MSIFWVIGAGGIGQALTRLLQNKGHQVHLISRRTESGGHQLDSTDPVAVDAWVKARAQQVPDVIVNTIGFFHDDHFQPEKNLLIFSEAQLAHSVHVNVIPTANWAQAIQQHLLFGSSKLKFACFSARVSSVSDNHLGGWYSYRMSKAALNMLIKNLSIEWKRRCPNVTIMGYHPGTVDTALSVPFQANVKPGKLFSPAQAAGYCYEQINQMTPEYSGQLIDWQGEIISP